jgi:hypothetical protein
MVVLNSPVETLLLIMAPAFMVVVPETSPLIGRHIGESAFIVNVPLSVPLSIGRHVGESAFIVNVPLSPPRHCVKDCIPTSIAMVAAIVRAHFEYFISFPYMV